MAGDWFGLVWLSRGFCCDRGQNLTIVSACEPFVLVFDLTNRLI